MGPWVCVPPNCGHPRVGEAPGKLTLDSGVPQEDPKDWPPVGSQHLDRAAPTPSSVHAFFKSELNSDPPPHPTLTTPTKCLPKGVCLYPVENQPLQGLPATQTSSLATLLRAPSSPALPPPTWAKWGREPGNKLFSHPLLAWETYHHLPTPHHSHAHPHTHAKP